MRVGRGVPHRRVDAVDDAGEDGAPGAEQPVEAHAAGGRADLLGIGRAHRGDRVGVVEPGLEEADAAVILDALDVPGRCRQAEAREDRRREAALEGDVVDGDDGLRRLWPGMAEIGRGEAGLPVVAMDDVRDEGLDRAFADVGGSAAERGEALPVVRPVGAVGREVGVAGPVEQFWRVEDDEVEAAGGA